MEFLTGFAIGVGVGVAGSYIYSKKKNNVSNCKEVECIKLFEVLDYLRRDEIQKLLSENENLKLFAKRNFVKKNGKEMIQISLLFFNSEKNDYDSSLPKIVFLSEKMDDMLTEKFGNGSVWCVKEAVL